MRDRTQHLIRIENHIALFVKHSFGGFQVPSRHSCDGSREQRTHSGVEVALAQSLMRQEEQVHVIDYCPPIVCRQGHVGFRRLGGRLTFKGRQEQCSFELRHRSTGLRVVGEKLSPGEPVAPIQSSQTIEPDQTPLKALSLTQVEETRTPSTRKARSKPIAQTLERWVRRFRPKDGTGPGLVE